MADNCLRKESDILAFRQFKLNKPQMQFNVSATGISQRTQHAKIVRCRFPNSEINSTTIMKESITVHYNDLRKQMLFQLFQSFYQKLHWLLIMMQCGNVRSIGHWVAECLSCQLPVASCQMIRQIHKHNTNCNNMYHTYSFNMP